MRANLRSSSFCIVFSMLFYGANAQENLALDSYTCAQFLSDSKSAADGNKVLKSLMMISWATGYATAFQQKVARADAAAFVLMAGTLGDTCQKHPTQTAVQAIVDAVNQFTSSNAPNSTPNPTVISAPSPAMALRGTFNTYDNFDLDKGDMRTVKNIESNKCVALCEADKACQAYSFDKWNKRCYLKSSVTALVLDPSAITGVRKTAGKPPASDAAVRINRRLAKSFEGTRLGTVSVTSPELCQQACEQDGKCLGFTFFRTDQACHFFDKISTFSSNSNSISGDKTQHPP